MTEIGLNLRRLLNESETFVGNAKRLSLSSGLGESVVGDIIRGRSKLPLVETLMKIAATLGCAVTDIDPTIDPLTGLRRGEKLSPVRQGNSIPIRGTEGVVGYTSRPTSLARVTDAYATYMTGNHMEPRLEQGWLLYVHPLRPPNRGRNVVVRKIDGSIVVARFVEQTADELVLEQLNPVREIRISLRDVRDAHLIIGLIEEGG